MCDVKSARVRPGLEFFRLIRQLSRLIVLLAGLTTPMLLTAAPADGLTATVAARSVRVTGVTPRAEVLAYWYQMYARGFDSEIDRGLELLRDEDGDGTVELTSGADYASRAIFVFIDLKAGKHVVASPDGFVPERFELKPGSLHGAGDDADRYTVARANLEVLYVHPGRGAWHLAAGDGGPSDADARTDGVTTISARHGKAIAPDVPVHAAFAPGGVFVVLDEMRMSVFAGRLEPRHFGGAR